MKKLFTFNLLRTLFIFGFSVVVCIIVSPIYYLQKVPPERRSPTLYEEFVYLFQDSLVAGIFIVMLLVISVAFIVLAISYPKRWVFITGAIFAAFNLFFGIFMPTPLGVRYLSIARMLCFIAGIFGLTGFFINPKKKK